MTKADVLIGLQWGDEEKGLLVDYLASHYDVIARFNGGPNCSRTIPHGVGHSDKLFILGNGVCIAPDRFMDEVKQLEAAGVHLRERLLISNKAHLVLHSHRLLDAAIESVRAENKIGTSGQGVGPSMSDKVNRIGLQVGDIQNNFAERYATSKAHHETTMRTMHYYSPYDIKEVESKWLEGIECMKRFRFIDSERHINKLLTGGSRILCEGGRGTMLDIDFGSYPFVTSDHAVSASACIGLGIPPTVIGDVYGVMKIYSTRVGFGPMPTELFDANAKKMREKVAGRSAAAQHQLRCGWIDLVALKYAIMLNGVTKLVLTGCNSLSDFDTVKACVAYKKGTDFIDYYPFGIVCDEIEPIYVEMQGWKSNISEIRSESQLPEAFMDFVRFIEKELGMPVSYLSLASDTEHIIERQFKK
ncbi:MAG: adenylosuccinate synthetase [Bacteroidaceae bacterium]|nr:adenylosuccinate synthetase [Bacteroidaceae bacterium]